MKSKLLIIIILSIFSIIIYSQDMYEIEIGKNNKSEMEPSIAVNPNDPTEAVIAWIERNQPGTNYKQVLYASLKKDSVWAIVHSDTLPTDPNHDKVADPVVVFLENNTVYISTVSRSDDSLGIYLSWSDNLFENSTPNWHSEFVFNDGGDKEWLAGYYDEYQNKSILYSSLTKNGYIIISNIEIDNNYLTYSIDTLDVINNFGVHWSTLATADTDTVYCFWSRNKPFEEFTTDDHFTDFVFKKKSYNQNWNDVPLDTVIADLWTSKLQATMNKCSPHGYPAVSYSTYWDRLAIAITFVDSTNRDNYNILLLKSDDHGNSWDNITPSFLQNQDGHFVLPWLSFDGEGILSIIYNYSDGAGPDTSLLKTYINISYDGGNTFPLNPININSEINDADSSLANRYEYIGLDSSPNNIYAAFVQYGEQSEPPQNGDNIKFVNWENIQPPAPFIINAGYSENNHPYISWRQENTNDINNFRIYRRLFFDSEFYSLIETVDDTITSFVDQYLTIPDERQDPYAHYMVKSIDASEWISNRSNIISIHVDDYVDDGLGKFASENDIRPKGIYPNPFNPETNISFEITHSSNVEINIFDINGRLIESVLNDYLDKGIYLYK